MEGNSLQVVDGIAGLTRLEELHVSSQRLAPGTSLEFEPASMHGLARSLSVLCSLQNGLTDDSVAPLESLSRLTKLDLSRNQVCSVDALEPVLRSASNLQSLDLRENPVCKAAKYRDQVILASEVLRTLDEEAVSTTQRDFLLRLHIKKMKAQLKAEEAELALIQRNNNSNGAAGGATSQGAAGQVLATSSSGRERGDVRGQQAGDGAPPPGHQGALSHRAVKNAAVPRGAGFMGGAKPGRAANSAGPRKEAVGGKDNVMDLGMAGVSIGN